MRGQQYKDEIIESLNSKGFNYKHFEHSIDILVGMKVQEDVLSKRLDGFVGTEEGKTILQEAIQQLREDIYLYSDSLLLDD